MEKKSVASRGGHAPGHLRDALLDCFEGQVSKPWYKPLGESEALVFRHQEMQAAWDVMGLKQRAQWLIGQLWNCTDVLPSMACENLDIQRGSTYAQAARKLKADLG